MTNYLHYNASVKPMQPHTHPCHVISLVFRLVLINPSGEQSGCNTTLSCSNCSHVSCSLPLSHTHKQKSKVSSCPRVTHAWQAGTMCQCDAISWEGQGACRRTDCTSLPLQVWVAPKVPPVLLVVCEAQPVNFAPQYKTRYPEILQMVWAGEGGSKIHDCNCYSSEWCYILTVLHWG